MAGSQTDLRIALLGPVGSGKSSAANLILGRDWFRVNFSPRAVTQICEVKKTVVKDKIILVIDTPGLFGPSKKAEINEMKNCAKMSAPGLHAFLMVIKLGVRLTEEKNLMNLIQSYFGDDAAHYTIILFTHTELLNGEPLEDYLADSPELQALIDACGGKYFFFNNKDKSNRNQVTKLLQMVDEMVEINEGHHLTTEKFNRVWTFGEVMGVGVKVGALGIAFGLGAVTGVHIMKQL